MTSLSELLELRQVVSAFLGAFVALIGRAAWERWHKAWVAKRLAVAFWQEMKGVEFGQDAQGPYFGGFTSQTFDTLFSQLAESLPDQLARCLMAYHWRMKFLEDQRDLYRYTKFVEEAKQTREDLLLRLQRYGEHSVSRLMLNRAEHWTEHWE